MQPATITLPKITVNPDVLKWARVERGLSLADGAKKIGISEIELAEYESPRPSVQVDLGILRRMSDGYGINRVSLFLPQPPPPLKKLHDFRTAVKRRSALHQETLLAIQDVRDSLDAFAELRDLDPKAVDTPQLDKVLRDESAEALAKRQRRRFGVSVKEQFSWHSPAYARDQWRRRIEEFGVFVYLKPMDKGDCRGFSLFHDGLAAICVNDREESPGAEAFTLLHEFCHLLLRNTGISDENQVNRIERYCNRFAASFLIPIVDLRDQLKSPTEAYDYPDKKIHSLANKFKVSDRAMALRLEETRLAPKGYYNAHPGAWDLPKVRVRQIKGGATAVQKAAKALGRRHTKTVLRAYGKGALSAPEAHALLDVPRKSFRLLEMAVE